MNELKWNGIEWNEMNEWMNERMKWTKLNWNEMKRDGTEWNGTEWNEMKWIKKIYVINEWMN